MPVPAFSGLGFKVALLARAALKRGFLLPLVLMLCVFRASYIKLWVSGSSLRLLLQQSARCEAPDVETTLGLEGC